MGALATSPADGVRVGGQDAEDAGGGVQRGGHVALLQGHGAVLHPLPPMGDIALDHRQDEQTRL